MARLRYGRAVDHPAPLQSDAEIRFDRIRARVAWVLAPLVAFALLFAPLGGLEGAARQVAIIDAVVVILWIGEAVPLWVPAVLGPAAAWAVGATDFGGAFAPFVHDLILLFLGGFVLAAGLARRGVDRRVALWTLARPWVDGRPGRARFAIASVAFVFSMWISNTATTAMMVPIALGLCANLEAAGEGPSAGGRAGQARWTEGTLLALAYGASLGGVCTPIGTAPNMIAINHLQETLGLDIDFLGWMRFAVPIGVIAFVCVLWLAQRKFPAPVARLESLTRQSARAMAELGAVRRSERRVVAVFGLAVFLWVAPAFVRLLLGDGHALVSWGQRWLEEGWVAVACAALLLLIPHGDPARPDEGRFLLRPREAIDIDWGTLLLLGGGFSLGKLTFATGLAAEIGDGVLALAPGGAFGLLAVATILVLYLTELTSNTATTSMMLPVLTPAALAAGYPPIPVALCVTMAASFAFMMPVSTPPNAIVYGTRRVRITSMIRFGAWLDLAGIAILLAAGAWLLPQLSW